MKYSMARPSSRSPPEIRHVLNQTKLEIHWVVAFQIPYFFLFTPDPGGNDPI